MEKTMTKPDQAGASQPPAQPGRQDGRSDNLLPDDGKSDDGRFEVAEEVSLDQQSDTARQVGEAPAGGAADAVAKSLRDNNSAEDSEARK
jgi:hypothetical protein